MSLPTCPEEMDIIREAFPHFRGACESGHGCPYRRDLLESAESDRVRRKQSLRNPSIRTSSHLSECERVLLQVERRFGVVFRNMEAWQFFTSTRGTAFAAGGCKIQNPPEQKSVEARESMGRDIMCPIIESTDCRNKLAATGCSA